MRPVNKVIYIVLCLFLGVFGIHKFYAGKNLQGILYILFSWSGVPAFLCVIDIIVALFKESDRNGNIYF